MLHAGLDLSRDRLDVCLLSGHGELVEAFASSQHGRSAWLIVSMKEGGVVNGGGVSGPSPGICGGSGAHLSTPAGEARNGSSGRRRRSPIRSGAHIDGAGFASARPQKRRRRDSQGRAH
jgi:hypothetical protein